MKQQRAQVAIDPYWLRPDPTPLQVGPKVGTLTLTLSNGLRIRVDLCTERESIQIAQRYGDSVVSAMWISDPPGGPMPAF